MQKESIGYLVQMDGYSNPKMKLSECLSLYQQQKVSDDFFIYGERIYDGKFEVTFKAPAVYHLFDFKSDKGLRAVHMTVKTCPWLKDGYHSRAVSLSINNHYGLGFLDKIMTRSPEKITKAIKFVEERLVVTNSNFESPLFSGRGRSSDFYFYGLMFELDKVLTK